MHHLSMMTYLGKILVKTAGGKILTDWKCKICGYKDMKANVEDHMFIKHTKIRTQTCELCGKVLKNPIRLRNHMSKCSKDPLGSGATSRPTHPPKKKTRRKKPSPTDVPFISGPVGRPDYRQIKKQASQIHL